MARRAELRATFVAQLTSRPKTGLRQLSRRSFIPSPKSTFREDDLSGLGIPIQKTKRGVTARAPVSRMSSERSLHAINIGLVASTLERGFLRNSLKVSAIALSIAGCFGTVLTTPVAAEVESHACTLTLLPTEMQRHIQTNYSSWQVQDVSNLSANARERWQSEKPLDCPGIAVGQFEYTDQKSYAVLLVPADKPDAGYRLLVFTPNGSHSPEAVRVIDESDKIGASNFFVHKIQIAKVFNSQGVKKLRINAKEGILFVDAGILEYEADVYSWTGDKYRHDPIDY